LLENAALYLPSHGKIGMVGANGCGETALFKTFFSNENIATREIFIKSKAKLICVQEELKMAKHCTNVCVRALLQNLKMSDEQLANDCHADAATDG
jgi:ATPase subunit of ABC transporter with duplicated ATPase domains